MELMFNAETYTRQGRGKDLVDATVELVKENLNGVKSIDYSEKNENLKKNLVSYASEIANIDTSMYDLTNEMDFAQALDDKKFANAMFSVVLKSLEKINTKAELNQMYQFIEFLSLADGDSFNTKREANGIVEFESTGYSNNAQLLKYRFDDNKVILPERKETAIACDLYQMTAYGFDFAKFVADIALGERRDMQLNAINALMASSTPITGAFTLTNFAKDDYIELVEKLQSFNGRGIKAYGTRSAWTKVSDSGIDAKYLYGSVGDEMVKTGMIADIYNVPSVVLDQAISKDGQFNLQVPSDKLVLCPEGIRPVKLIMEGTRRIRFDNDGDNSIGLRTYKVISGWKADVVTNGSSGLVLL